VAGQRLEALSYVIGVLHKAMVGLSSQEFPPEKGRQAAIHSSGELKVKSRSFSREVQQVLRGGPDERSENPRSTQPMDDIRFNTARRSFAVWLAETTSSSCGG